MVITSYTTDSQAQQENQRTKGEPKEENENVSDETEKDSEDSLEPESSAVKPLSEAERTVVLASSAFTAFVGAGARYGDLLSSMRTSVNKQVHLFALSTFLSLPLSLSLSESL